LPTIAYLEGEYGYEGIYLGVPTIVGGNGLEQIIELELTDYEKTQLNKSAESVKNVMKVLS
jgi:malate dehydrogenase